MIQCKKVYCIDCDNQLGASAYHSNTIRCRSCESKRRLENPKNNNFYIHGKSLKKYYCIDCGVQLSGKYERCQSCAQKRERSHNWNGGVSFEEYGVEFDSALKEQVRFRDKYKCRKCGCTQLENGRQLDVHHIDYNKKNNIIINLISLCRRCHAKTNYNREFWMNLLKKIITCCIIIYD